MIDHRIKLRWLTLGFTAVFLAGCRIQVDLPEQFLELHANSSEFKATTADEAMFWVDRFDLPAAGDNLEFWGDALKHDFVDNRGYLLIREKAVHSDAGLPGRLMVFESTIQGSPYRSMVGLFLEPASFLVSGPVACLPRFTAPKAEFDRLAAEMERTILTTR